MRKRLISLGFLIFLTPYLWGFSNLPQDGDSLYSTECLLSDIAWQGNQLNFPKAFQLIDSVKILMPDDLYLQGRLIYEEASLYFKMNSVFKCIDLLMNLKSIVDESQNVHLTALYYYRFTTVFWDIEDARSHVQYLDSAYHYAQQTTDHILIARILMNYGNINKNHIKSVAYYQRALEEIAKEREGDSSDTYLAILFNLAVQESDSDFPVKAFNRFEQIIRISQQYQRTDVEANAKYHIGKLYLGQNNMELSQKYLHEALILAETKKDFLLLAFIYEELSKYYMSNADTEKAYETYTNHKRYFDKAQTSNNVILKNYAFQALLNQNTRSKFENIQKNYRQSLDNLSQMKQTSFLLTLVICILVILFGSIFIYERKRRKHEKELKDKNLKLAEEKLTSLNHLNHLTYLKALQLGEEKVKKQLAMKLHDSTAGSIAGIKLKLCSYADAKERPSNFEEIINDLDSVYNQVRNLSHTLLPPNFHNDNFANLLFNLIGNFRTHSAIAITSNIYPEDLIEKLPDFLKMEIYRILQELLLNIHKHSEAKKAEISITIFEEELTLVVEDYGKGMATDMTSKGIGLINVKERISYMDGHINIESRIGEGTAFLINLPIRKTIKQTSNITDYEPIY